MRRESALLTDIEAQVRFEGTVKGAVFGVRQNPVRSERQPRIADTRNRDNSSLCNGAVDNVDAGPRRVPDKHR